MIRPMVRLLLFFILCFLLYSAAVCVVDGESGVSVFGV